MEAKTIERKYALTKIGPGDWLLPANDGETIYRLMKHEDGPSYGLIDVERDFITWGIWKWEPSALSQVHGALDPDDWNDWGMVDDNCPTRAEAIDRALRREP